MVTLNVYGFERRIMAAKTFAFESSVAVNFLSVQAELKNEVLFYMFRKENNPDQVVRIKKRDECQPVKVKGLFVLYNFMSHHLYYIYLNYYKPLCICSIVQVNSKNFLIFTIPILLIRNNNHKLL